MEEQLKQQTLLVNECWEWQGHRTEKGYGRTRYKGKQVYLHRLMYELTYGEFDKSLQVRHTCDNPPCINPDHLRLGTNKDNVNDKISRGRQHRLTRNQHGNSLLTEDEVKDLLFFKSKGYTNKALAELYNMNILSIKTILRVEKKRDQIRKAE